MSDTRAHDLLTVAEAAERLRTPESTIRRWCAEGRLSSTRIGRQLLIGRAGVDAIIADANRPVPMKDEHAETNTMNAPRAFTMSAARGHRR